MGLQDVYAQLQERPFPRSSADPIVADLHAELAAYDTWVAGYISRLLQGERLAAERFQPDRELGDQLRNLAAHAVGEAALSAREYLSYYELLNSALDAARIRAQ